MTKALRVSEHLIIIDDDMLRKLCSQYWRIVPGRRAEASIKNERIYVANFLFGALPEGLFHDHINHNPLDNRRINIRQASFHQNMMNKTSKTHPNRPYKGVYYLNPAHYKEPLWNAKISFNHKTYFLGRFDTAKEAAEVYDAAARELYGEFANCNFKLEHEIIPEPVLLKSDIIIQKERKQTSKYRGVSYSHRNDRDKNWTAQAYVDRKAVYIGRFYTEEEAHLAYEEFWRLWKSQ